MHQQAGRGSSKRNLLTHCTGQWQKKSQILNPCLCINNSISSSRLEIFTISISGLSVVTNGHLKNLLWWYVAPRQALKKTGYCLQCVSIDCDAAKQGAGSANERICGQCREFWQRWLLAGTTVENHQVLKQQASEAQMLPRWLSTAQWAAVVVAIKRRRFADWKLEKPE